VPGMAPDSPEIPDLRKWRLPRGRHGLPRELIARSQRERLLAAVVRTTAANGCEATTVADILEEAGVGRESFYELFEDRQDCMLSAHRVLTDDLAERVEAAYLGEGAWAERLRAALDAALRWFAADPAAARFVLIDLAPLGTPFRARFHDEFRRFLSLLGEGPEGPPRAQAPRAGILALSAAVAGIHEEVAHGRTERLPEKLPQLLYEVLVPFLGEAGAQRERQRAEAG